MSVWYWGEQDNDEAWHGPFLSRAKAVRDANAELDQGETFSTAKLYRYKPHIDAGQLLDDLGEDASDYEFDLWPDVTQEQQDELERQLNAVLLRWLRKVGQMPTFGDLEDISTHTAR